MSENKIDTSPGPSVEIKKADPSVERKPHYGAASAVELLNVRMEVSRVDINSATLYRLLIDKGLITAQEFEEARKNNVEKIAKGDQNRHRQLALKAFKRKIRKNVTGY